MKIISTKNAKLALRPSYETKAVEKIIAQVAKNGDEALKKFEKKFSGVSPRSFAVSKKEIKEAYKLVSKKEIEALGLARLRLARTELALKKQLKKSSVCFDGVKITKIFVPLDVVGCYIPGGLAKYPSSALMCITPAKVAGVRKIVVVTPPNRDGKVDPLVLVACDMCGADLIFKVGGAHAIAALAFGTDSVPQVDKIVGPGGPYVTAAKYLVSNITSIDMLAGPTELAIIADDTADARLVALDLISQAEHSPDTLCCLVTTSKKFGLKVIEQVKNIVPGVQRSKIISSSLKKNGFVALCDTISEAVNFVNKLAPEHLEIMVKNETQIADKITSAGMVLLGKNSPSSASDYILGTNHVLPTNRFGRARGSLSVLDYLKVKTVVKSTQNDLSKINKQLRLLAESEELPNHYNAVRGRL